MKIAILSFLAAIAICGCGSRGDNMAGDWKSQPHQTEWGEVICTLSMRPDSTCTFSMSPTDDPNAEPIVSEGKWQPDGQAAATILWSEAKTDARVVVSIVNQTTIIIDPDGDAISLRKNE